MEHASKWHMLRNTMFVASLVCIAGCFARAQNWPMLNGNMGRTSYVRVPGSITFPSGFSPHGFTVESAGALTYSAGTLYVTSLARTPNACAAYSADGQRHWLFEIPNSAAGMNFSAPVHTDYVYAGGQQGLGLYALNRFNGAVLWSKFLGGLYGRSPILESDRLYVIGDSLYCLNARNGAAVWKDRLSSQGSVAVDEGRVYAWSSQDSLIAFDKLNGTRVWTVHNDERWGLAVDADGLFTIHEKKVVSRRKSDGAILWSCAPPSTSTSFGSHALAVSDTRVICAIWSNQDNKAMLFSIDKGSGALQWDYTFPDEGVFTPTLVNDLIFATCYKARTVTCLDARNGLVLHVAAPISDGYFAEQPIWAGQRLFVPSSSSVQVFDMLVGAERNDAVHEWAIKSTTPHPVSRSAEIRYSVASHGPVRLSVVDVLGRECRTLVEGMRDAGEYDARLDTAGLPPGVYMLRFSWEGGAIVSRIVHQ